MLQIYMLEYKIMKKNTFNPHYKFNEASQKQKNNQIKNKALSLNVFLNSKEE